MPTLLRTRRLGRWQVPLEFQIGGHRGLRSCHWPSWNQSCCFRSRCGRHCYSHCRCCPRRRRFPSRRLHCRWCHRPRHRQWVLLGATHQRQPRLVTRTQLQPQRRRATQSQRRNQRARLQILETETRRPVSPQRRAHRSEQHHSLEWMRRIESSLGDPQRWRRRIEHKRARDLQDEASCAPCRLPL
ncbi:hypothetical protein PINS_up017196 [Pythium insidiosum]|nr:hypothetical protein PINS_up017196 [Pythium insidiosum]